MLYGGESIPFHTSDVNLLLDETSEQALSRRRERTVSARRTRIENILLTALIGWSALAELNLFKHGPVSLFSTILFGETIKLQEDEEIPPRVIGTPTRSSVTPPTVIPPTNVPETLTPFPTLSPTEVPPSLYPEQFEIVNQGDKGIVLQILDTAWNPTLQEDTFTILAANVEGPKYINVEITFALYFESTGFIEQVRYLMPGLEPGQSQTLTVALGQISRILRANPEQQPTVQMLVSYVWEDFD